MTAPAAEPAGQARALFSTLSGAAPASVWSSPGRVNLIGEHTDYNDGFVLPFAVDRRTYVALGMRQDRRIRVASTFDPEVVDVDLDDLDDLFPPRHGDDDSSRTLRSLDQRPEGPHPQVPEWAAYPLGVAWAVRRDLSAGSGTGGTEPGVDIAIASDVPVGAGLSSSAAIEGATAAALDDAWHLGLDRVALARAGRTAENSAVGAPTGIMDQMASMLGQSDAAIFLDCRSLHTEIVPLGFEDAGLELLVMDTGVKHSHATGGYRSRRESCERGAEVLGVRALRDVSIGDLERAATLLDDETFRRVRHIVTENQRVLDTVRTLREQGPLAIGPLLDASHASMRDDFEISVPELDTAVDAAVGAGAIGARMTGGGFGGAAIALVPHGGRERVEAAVVTAFEASGFARPNIFPVTPSEGARREA